MSMPPPGEPGETPEQRQARYNAAAAAHLRANPSSANRDPGFDINTATNTFYKALGDRVASGQMTLDQARAAQAEMRALQLNPAAANRQTATDIAQRHLQVGRYSPSQPQGGLTAIAPQPTPMPLPRMPIMPQPPEREVIGLRSPVPGVHGGDTRIFAPTTQPPMALPGGTGYDEQGNMIRSKPDYLSGIRSLLANFGKGMGNAPMQPKFIGKNFTGDAPPPGKKYIETPEGLVPVPINDVPVKPAMGPGLGRALGMPMQGVGMAPQMPMKPQGLTLSNVPQQQRLTLRNPPMQGNAPQYIGLANQSFQMGDPNFRFGQTPQVKAPNAQGMAMGGLMEKYYGGGMC